MNLKEVVISFWYKELEYNPICKVGELENSLTSFFQGPFLINEQEPFINIGLPRIVAHGINKDCLLNMNLVNVNLIINLSEVEFNDAILKINEISQTLFALLKEIYNLDIIYSSIKIEMFEIIKNKMEVQNSLLSNGEEYEDFLVKTCLCKDNKYYINRTTSLAKEVKIDIKVPKNVKFNDNDMIARSMLVSLDGKDFINVKNKVLEINNRLNYNNDSSYLVSKDDLRDLLFEFKNILKEEINL